MEVNFTLDPLSKSAFDKKINDLLAKAEGNIPCEASPDLPYMDHAPDVHRWHDFEFTIWNIAEEIRLLSLESKTALNKSHLDRIIDICLNKKARRVRQSFVMLLGKTKYRNYSGVLAPLLDDEDVNGHVIDTLYKMRAAGYATMITPFLNHKQTWIRNAAKKYVQKFSESSFKD